MATVLKCDKREFRENPNKIDNYRLLSDVSRIKSGVNPKNLNFDLRLLNPGQFSAPYHFHRNSEEFEKHLSGKSKKQESEKCCKACFEGGTLLLLPRKAGGHGHKNRHHSQRVNNAEKGSEIK